MAGTTLCRSHLKFDLKREVSNMSNHLISNRSLRLAVFLIANSVLIAVVSVPVGAEDKPLSKSEISALIASAETKADHQRIAHYFDAEAAKYRDEAKEHGELAPFYHRSEDPAMPKHPGSQRTFQHIDSLITSLQQAAEDAHQLAAEHKEMAKAEKK